MKRIALFILILSFIGILHGQERHIITSDSVDLYFNVKGTGVPCLYIHGGPGSGSYWMELFLGDFLEQHFQMVYLDQRGTGRSSSPENNDYSMGRMIKDFEEVRGFMGIDRWLTLGHSFGGLLQMGYVSARPNSIAGMMLINCTLSMEDSFGTSWLPKAIELAGADVPAASIDTSLTIFERMSAIIPVLGQKGIMWKIFFADEENSRKMNDTYSNFQSWNTDQSEKILEDREYWQDFSIHSSEVKQPVLFYYGKTDWAVGPNHYRKAAFPNMLLWGSDTGHMPFLENRPDLEKGIISFAEKNGF
jgi:proline iminopeptidase